MRLPLVALAVSTFAIGTTEFVVVGILPQISASLGVKITTAGLLVSLYALAITLGTPTFSALTDRFPRRMLVIVLMTVFTATNLTAALSPTYGALLASRLVMAVAHGVFFGVGATVATSLVPREKAGSAVAIMMGGLTLAMVVGVPLGSWIGQAFSWRTPFFVVAGMGVVAVAGLVAFLPRRIDHVQPVSVFAQLSLLGNRRLALMYLLTAVGFGGTFVVFTFFSPLLTQVTGVSAGFVNWALLVFGGATFIGNFAGGQLTDALGTRRAMMILLAGLAMSFALLSVAIHDRTAILVVIGLWGIFGFAIPPVMQSGVVAVAREVAPDALGTASGFNIAAFNLGISGGSFAGGRLVDGPGVAATPYAAILLALAAMLIAALTLPARSRPLLEPGPQQV